MTLTKEMQKKVEENMGLVGKVISDKIHGFDTPNFYSYDDLFQIGCIGLCKAAYSDCGGTFSTYAYRLIWNELCDALRYGVKNPKRNSYLRISAVFELKKLLLPHLERRLSASKQ